MQYYPQQCLSTWLGMLLQGKMSGISPCRQAQRRLWAQIMYQLFAKQREEEGEEEEEERDGGGVGFEEKNNIRTKKQSQTDGRIEAREEGRTQRHGGG